jgi:hypothetical protein
MDNIVAEDAHCETKADEKPYTRPREMGVENNDGLIRPTLASNIMH